MSPRDHGSSDELMSSSAIKQSLVLISQSWDDNQSVWLAPPYAKSERGGALDKFQRDHSSTGQLACRKCAQFARTSTTTICALELYQ